jgi:hypothetical protein
MRQRAVTSRINNRLTWEHVRGLSNHAEATSNQSPALALAAPVPVGATAGAEGSGDAGS